jgi:hypothetical protein
MPALIIAAGVVVLLLVVAGVVVLARQLVKAKARNAVRGVPWTTYENAYAGITTVAVARVADDRVLQRVDVARIPDSAQDWTEQLHKARGQASERAAALNAGRTS